MLALFLSVSLSLRSLIFIRKSDELEEAIAGCGIGDQLAEQFGERHFSPAHCLFKSVRDR